MKQRNPFLTRVLLITVAVILLVVLIFLLIARCSGLDARKSNGSESSGIPAAEMNRLIEEAKQIQAEVIDPADFDFREVSFEGLPFRDCAQNAKLLISDSFGRPPAPDGSILPDISEKTEPSTSPTGVLPFVPDISIVPIIPIVPIPSLPIFTEVIRNEDLPGTNPSDIINIETPAADAELIGGSAFTLKWSLDSGRTVTITIYFSNDGGKTFSTIATGIDNKGKYDLTIPSVVSSNCVFRVDVYIGNSFTWYNLTPVFRVIAPPTPSPSPSPTPSPFPAPPPKYVEEDGVLIIAGVTAARWFQVEHESAAADHIVWQISRTPFLCGFDYAGEKPSGLLAEGKIDPGRFEFKLDFSAIMNALTGSNSDPGSPEENTGDSFSLGENHTLLPMSQYPLYVRAILMDKDSNILGVTSSDFLVIYGTPGIDSVSDLIPYAENLPEPPTIYVHENPYNAGNYFTVSGKSNVFYAGKDPTWQFYMSDMSANRVESDFQITSVPFKPGSAQLRSPDGLVFSKKESSPAHSVYSGYYRVDFSKFAPDLSALGKETIEYYVRIVYYIPSDYPGAVIPIVSETGVIFYTGDSELYILDIPPITYPPEEVPVNTGLPSADFHCYEPPRWALYECDKYYEVTRPIQAEEMSFSITNNKTGDFLLPYDLHMYLYPNTTREQYQEVLDRMLPPGASFKLTLKEKSGLAKIWSDYMSLLEDIYEGIRTAYSDLKKTVVNIIVDRFEFLGDDAQSFLRKAVTGLIDYGLASVGIPPNLPNFAELSEVGMDYCLDIAYQTAAAELGVSVDELPQEVKNQVSHTMKEEMKKLSDMSGVNPLNVDFLQPSKTAMYRPAYVTIKIYNNQEEISPAGELMIGYRPVVQSHFYLYEYAIVPVPPLKPHELTLIRVYLHPANTDRPVWNEYFNGTAGDCKFFARITYDIPSADILAAQQGVTGTDSRREDIFVYDQDPIIEFSTIAPPCEPYYGY
ncbi:MAG: hypothetical protein GX099_02595 [Clostridiaceae bacterium]|nr:hypothetical protein [Clostridiaceae bacterium]